MRGERISHDSSVSYILVLLTIENLFFDQNANQKSCLRMGDDDQALRPVNTLNYENLLSTYRFSNVFHVSTSA